MSLLVTVGDLVTDLIIKVAADEIDPVSDTPAVIERHRGGSAANVAVVSARLGRPARFVGNLGRDEAGRALVAELESLGIEAVGPSVERGVTIAVLVGADGSRRFLTDRGTEAPWPRADPAWIANGGRVHLTGYALANDYSASTVLELAAQAKAAGMAISLDPSSVSVIDAFGQQRFAELLAEVCPDVVLPNEDEADLVLEAALRIGALVVQTNGARSTEVFWPDGNGALVPVDPVEVLDTTGAGDAFAAGFLASYDRDGHVLAAVAAGHEASRRVVGGVGASAWEHGSDD
ncbi:MAG: hypothetical protein GX868_02285 [Actinobacteria bacterium]|nr:hypothetical protein [Actinomycetota bacterium]